MGIWKKVGLATLAAGLTVGLAACGSKSSESNQKTLTVTVDKGYKNYINDIKGDFEKKNGVKVVVKTKDALTTLDSLKLDGPAGKAADVMMAPFDRVAVLGKQGQLATVKLADDGRYNDADKKNVTLKGKTYGEPVTIETLVMYYNKDLIKKAPTSFKELETLSKDSKFAYENDKTKNVAFLTQWTNFYNAYGLIKGYGGYVFGDNGTNPKEIGLNNKGAVEGLTYISDWFKNVWPKGMMSASSNENFVTDQFTSGKTAVIIDGPWMAAKYKKAKTALKEFKPADLHELRSLGLELSKYIRSLDKRIIQAEVGISMQCGDSHLANTLGLKCDKQVKVFIGGASIIASDTDGEHRSGSTMFISFKSLDDLKEKALKKLPIAVSDAVDFFKSGPVKGKTYKAVLAPSVAAALLSFFTSQLQAKLVKQHLSIFENKIDQQIASKSLTIKHTPHVTNASASSFDTEGVPTQDFTVIDKGVLKTYFYSLETARYFNTKSNGCACGNGNSAPLILSVKPGKYSKEDLFAKIKNGLYINDVSGLNSGIDSTSLNFSLPCQGYLIKDGKKDKAVSMIIMAGNLLDLFNNISYVGSDVYDDSSIITPSIAVKKLAVSGK